MNDLKLWKRGFLEIIAEILSSFKASSLTKTGIIAKCNLDSRACTKYLSVMESLDLVSKSKADSSFRITKKGTDFFHQYESLVGLIEDDMEKFNSLN